MTSHKLNGLVVYCHDVSNIEARVCASLPDTADEDWQLTGQVRGPRCEFARTLQATIPLRPSPSESGLPSTAVVPDPCLWTPELPMLYDVHVELRHGEKIVETVDRPLAIRMFRPQGRSLTFSGRRWVLRGVSRSTAPDAPPPAWREASAAMFVEAPVDSLSAESARLGVPLAIKIRETDPAGVERQLHRFAHWPAVIIVAIDATADLPDAIGQSASSILLAAHCRAKSAPAALPGWARMLLCESTDAAELARAVAGRDYPAIAMRPLEPSTDIALARAACDRLQADLAPHMDLAGYIV